MFEDFCCSEPPKNFVKEHGYYLGLRYDLRSQEAKALGQNDVRVGTGPCPSAGMGCHWLGHW